MIKNVNLPKIKIMTLEGIINVSGKPGLYKVISRSNNTVIIESLLDNKRSAIYSHNQANLLNEIGIYTYNDTTPLCDVFTTIANKTNCGPSINHKLSKEELFQLNQRNLTESIFQADVYLQPLPQPFLKNQ